MPTKRKSSSAFTDDSPTRRFTRSSAGLLPDAPLSRPSIIPKKPLKTYGRTSCRTSLITESSDPQNGCKEVDEGIREESSEDELNLSPSRSHKPPLRRSPSRVVEVTILVKRPGARRDIAARPDSPAVKRNMPTGKAHRSSPTTNDDVDQLEQDGDSDDTPLSSLPETSKILPSTKVLTSSGNLRKRRQDGEFSPPPSPKKLKPPTATRACPTSNSSSTARRALPLCVTDSLSCSSPARRSTKSASIPASPPPNEVIPLPASSPSKMRLTYKPTELPQEIPPHLHSCLDVQKRAILRALHHNAPKALYGNEYEESEDEAATNEIAFQQLMNVLTGTVNRGEGNSCLILGPRGSGKTSVSDTVLCKSTDARLFLSLLNNAYQTYLQSLLYFAFLAGHSFPTALQCAKSPTNLVSRPATAFFPRKTTFLNKNQMMMKSVTPF